MNNDKNKPFDELHNPFTKNKGFDIFKRPSFMPDLFENEDDDDSSKQRKLFHERTTRSKSHYHYHCRPEFVPKPKPKRARVIPSPMKLKNKFVLSNNESDSCLSPLESGSEGQLYLEEVGNDYDYDNDNKIDDQIELRISNMRKTLTKIRTSPLKKQAKDCEEVFRASIGFNKKQRKSVFAKTIKGFIEDENENNKNLLTMSIGPNIHNNISILGVLEQTAGNISQLNLIKCKSTIL